MATSDLTLESLRGGLDDTTPVAMMAKDACTEATNVEFFWSTLGERRYGCEAFDITGSGLDAFDLIAHISQWFPANNVVTPEIWTIGATPGTSAAFEYRDVLSAWHTPTVVDALADDAPQVYEVNATAGPASVGQQGKYFIAYPNSASQDRMHVWDPSGSATLRRAGLPQPSVPTVANEGVGTVPNTPRYYRIRIESQISGLTAVLSEPSDPVPFTPSGTGAGVRVTRPAMPSNEYVTHWVVEASYDPGGQGKYYVIAHVAVGTSVYDHTSTNPISFSDEGPLSDAIGAYLVPQNAKFVAVDSDRLVMGGHWTDVTLQSTVWWTPVSTDPGVGNDERVPISTTGGEPIASTLSLDNHSGGGITGMSTAIAGSWYVFKWSHIYKLTRTNRVTLAYQSMTMSTVRGAVPGSIFAGADENGSPAIFFLDPLEGPSMISSAGLRTIIGVRKTWNRVNLSATDIVARGLYYPYKRQAHWWVATEAADSPDYKLVLQVSELVQINESQVARGWSTATGRITECFSVGLITENTEVDNIQTIRSRPFVGMNTPDFIQRCDSETVTDDAGVGYTAVLTSAPIMVAGLNNEWGAMRTALLASANPNTSVRIRLIRDFGVETSDSIDVPLDPTEQDEPFVIKVQDGLVMSEAVAIQVQFSDAFETNAAVDTLSATLIPPVFAGLDPVDGMPSFWNQGSSEGLWDTIGDTDIGVDLRTIDANIVFAFNPANGDLLTQGAFFAFEDTSAIPTDAVIVSAQLIVDFDLIGINMSNGVTTFTPQWGAGAGTNIQLVDADTDDFTGSGTFMSDVMTVCPATGVAWVFEDLYGTPKPFVEPKGLQGWYFVQVNTGSGSDPNTAQYKLNYIGLKIIYEA